MTNTPLVSIIIPTYNRAHLIGETLDSVLAQTYTNWECIVVDDGSTDTTNEIMQTYLEKDVRFQYHQRPEAHLSGGNGARNYGFELSKGEYLQWFDDDDVMVSNCLEIKLEYAKNKQADIVVASHSSSYEQIKIQEHPELEIFKSAAFYIDYILGKKPLITNDVLVKRSIIKNICFDENLHKAQEFEFFTRLFNQNLTYCFSNQVLVWYRTNNSSINRKTGKNWVKKQESLIYLSKKLIDAHNIHDEVVERMYRQCRKTYKSLVLKNKIGIVFKHFKFFKDCFGKSNFVFFCFVLYNSITKRGFDRIKLGILGN